jgi:hypothetical protein
VYENDASAAAAAIEALADMYARLRPGQQLITGHGFDPFILHPLAQIADSCPDCGGEFFSVEAGYDRYGKVTLEDHVLMVEDDDFSEDGCGPLYLFCTECERTYAPPDGSIDYR